MLVKFNELAMEWSEGRDKKFSRRKAFQALTMCDKCYTYYYKSSWHFEKPENFPSEHDAAVPVRFTRCAACLEQDEALYVAESYPISSEKSVEWEQDGVTSSSLSH